VRRNDNSQNNNKKKIQNKPAPDISHQPNEQDRQELFGMMILVGGMQCSTVNDRTRKLGGEKDMKFGLTYV
jgi:hypothetical protein